MLYSFKGSRPEPLPFRIALPNGFTRTDPSTFSVNDIKVAGYEGPYEIPAYCSETEQVEWIDGHFVVTAKPPAPPVVEPLDLTAMANGILAAASTNDAESLAALLSDLMQAVKAQ